LYTENHGKVAWLEKRLTDEQLAAYYV